MSVTLTTIRDTIVADAKDTPALLASAKSIDPTFYGILTGNYTKTVWFAPAVALVAGGAARFGFGWDHDTCEAVAGIVLTAGLGLFHWMAPKLPVAVPAAPMPGKGA